MHGTNEFVANEAQQTERTDEGLIFIAIDTDSYRYGR